MKEKESIALSKRKPEPKYICLEVICEKEKIVKRLYNFIVYSVSILIELKGLGVEFV